MTDELALSLSWGSMAELRLDGRLLRQNAQLEDVLVELYARLRPPIVAYVFRLVGSTVDADDIVQSAFLTLWDHLQRDVEIRNVRSWLYRVVHNLAIDRASGLARRGASEATWLASANRPIRSAEDDLVARSEIANAMSLLSPREQECLMLRAEGLSYQEIADVLQTSAKAVSVHLTRGLRKFSERR